MNQTPSFWSGKNVGKLYAPQKNVVYAEGEAFARSKGLPSAAEDTFKVAVLLVDEQVDFVHSDGALSVPGAIDDTIRLCEWIIRGTQSGQLTHIAGSLDSHVPLQIFFPPWWINTQTGELPAPFTPITVADIENGLWAPRVSGTDEDGTDLQEWSYNYVELLEAQARKPLMIWPFHTLIGDPGHNIVPALMEVVLYHSGARGAQPQWLSKGSIPRTENYSIFEPEIKVPSHELGGLNTDVLDTIEQHDLIYVAGQAKSHCVLETVASMMNYWGPSSEPVSKMRVLTDTMSSVSHPDIDFEAIATEQFESWAENDGLTLVTTADPIG